VASRDLAKGRAYAAEWGISKVFGSYEDLLDSDAVDVVYISLPNLLHAEWTIRALEAGKHVLVEKPFATKIEDADRMIAASHKTGNLLMEAFMYRHHPQTKLVGEYLKEGRLGDVMLVRSAFSFFMDNRAVNVRLASDLDGGALWDVGIYPLSFSQFVFNRLPQSVSGQQFIGETGVDESFTGQMNYPGGRAAQITCSFRVPFFTSVEIHGSSGRLSFSRPFTNINAKEHEILFTPVNGQPQKLSVKAIDPYFGEVENMNSAFLEGAPLLVSLEESRNHVRTALALYESARLGKEISLE
jgi:predicted dehydrogenase